MEGLAVEVACTGNDKLYMHVYRMIDEKLLESRKVEPASSSNGDHGEQRGRGGFAFHIRSPCHVTLNLVRPFVRWQACAEVFSQRQV